MYEEFTLNVSVPFPPIAAAYLSDFYRAPALDKSCTDAHPLDPHQCWSQSVHYPYVSTPLLVAENRFDKNQIIAVLGMKGNGTTQEKYKVYFGKQMQDTAIHEVLTSPKHDGAFFPSCFEHTANLCMLGGSLVQNISYAAVLSDWYFGRNQLPHQLIDDCGDAPCNPKCTCV